LKVGNSSSIEQLRDGVAIARSTKKAIENETKLLLYTWQIGVHVTSAHFRLIVFTYTISAKLESVHDVQQEIAMLDKSIMEGEYPAIRGVSGNNQTRYCRPQQ